MRESEIRQLASQAKDAALKLKRAAQDLSHLGCNVSLQVEGVQGILHLNEESNISVKVVYREEF